MDQVPPLLRDQRKVDAEHLKLLAVFHFVGAGLGAIGLGFLVLHYSFMRLFFTNPKLWEGQHGGPPPAEFFAIFKWFYVVMGLFLLAYVVINLLSGFWIRARKHRTFSIVVAGLNCLQLPLGTALGVFTLVVLMRDSVREIYQS